MSKSLPTALYNEKNAELVEELKRENNYEAQEETQKRMKTLKLLSQVNREFIRIVGNKAYLNQRSISLEARSILTAATDLVSTALAQISIHLPSRLRTCDERTSSSSSLVY